jgi:hypothetical protein
MFDWISSIIIKWNSLLSNIEHDMLGMTIPWCVWDISIGIFFLRNYPDFEIFIFEVLFVDHC